MRRALLVAHDSANLWHEAYIGRELAALEARHGGRERGTRIISSRRRIPVSRRRRRHAVLHIPVPRDSPRPARPRQTGRDLVRCGDRPHRRRSFSQVGRHPRTYRGGPRIAAPRGASEDRRSHESSRGHALRATRDRASNERPQMKRDGCTGTVHHRRGLIPHDQPAVHRVPRQGHSTPMGRCLPCRHAPEPSIRRALPLGTGVPDRGLWCRSEGVAQMTGSDSRKRLDIASIVAAAVALVVAVAALVVAVKHDTTSGRTADRCQRDSVRSGNLLRVAEHIGTGPLWVMSSLSRRTLRR